ncbi:MAG TPA: hypothetical protein PKM39_05370 [Pseudothauera hydrothermalis]|jgi:hypothetical protein|uniref:hypothetical protein n=1 Tax=Pseudothauera hydrothermalis TaxID=2184083 RepID=UPI0013150497|nr:hypothetical protein [Pseudothauera hydrothermalis]HNQ76053.1 hypothetical protein [Pseudothauera hydrothermalis]
MNTPRTPIVRRAAPYGGRTQADVRAQQAAGRSTQDNLGLSPDEEPNIAGDLDTYDE